MSSENKSSKAPATMQTLFGLIMVIVYIGMGVLFFIGFFAPLYGSWTWIRWAAGALFTVYGIWRAYRQFKPLALTNNIWCLSPFNS